MVLLKIWLSAGGKMYWFRESNIFGFIPWLLVVLVWTIGGWLIATHAFNLEK